MAGAILLAPGLAQAQNILANGGFEVNPPTTNADHIGHSIAPWLLQTGSVPNVVRVGPGYTYTRGPNVDASGAGGFRNYLDITDAGNSIRQTFTPACSGTVTYRGYFSSRKSDSGVSLSGNGGIAIRQGDGFTGTVVTQSPVTAITNGNAWTPVVATVTAGQTYSFVATLDDNLNFDEASVVYNQLCVNTDVVYTDNPINPNLVLNVVPTTPDPCCPPWNEQMLSASLRYSSTGAINSPYTLQWQMPAGLNAQMQAYINYLNALDPSMTTISVAFGIFQAGNGATPGPSGVQVGGTGGTRIVTWTSGSNAPTFSGGTFFPANFLQPNQWYTVGTTTFLNDGIAFFGENCINKSISVRWQVAPGIGTGPTGAGAGRGPAVRSMEVRPAPRAIGPMGPARRALPQRR